MRILVTGGCGFIGSNFIQMLLHERPNAFVCNLDKLTYAGNPANLEQCARSFAERYCFERADIADAQAVRRILKTRRIDALVNFAAESHVDRSIADPSPFIRTNVLGTQILLAEARDAGIERFVHVSTDEVYGSLDLDSGPGFTEQTPLAPNSPYSASKASADLFCRAWFETYGYPAVITRCSNNYGPCQFPEKLIPLMYLRAMRDESLPVYGDGNNVRDWIHVADHCRGVLLALEKGRPGAVYNFGGNAERSNLDVVRSILSFCGKSENLIRLVKDRPGHDRRYAMDFSLAARELGFAPSFSFEKGLADTLAWYAANHSWVENITSGAYITFIQDWYGDRI
ncbi:dTDP-glucose 4,6-dehydratase [Desulfovibrio sp. OttesenSCG-928-M14]|nr:dTDP-glucose 4,6-dehydratase [Desulfovibrio sp. OttesenSCG-928-M14]